MSGEIVRDASLSGWPQSYKFFSSVESNVASAFALRRDLDDRAEAALGPYRRYGGGEGDGGSGGAVLVGVHVRRTDYENHTSFYSTGGGAESYFAATMGYFRSQHGKAVRFLVASDDVPWCRSRPFFSSDSANVDVDIHILDSDDPRLEFSILTKCDHLVLTVGTFGWWAAWLGPHQRKGGEVVYCDAAGRGSDEEKKDFWPSEWREMCNG